MADSVLLSLFMSSSTIDTEICLNTVVLVVTLMLLIGVVVTSMLLASYTTSRLVRRSNQLRKYRERDESEAPWKQKQGDDALQTQQRRNSSVSVITPKTSANEEVGRKPDNAHSSRLTSLQKQAPVSVIFDPQLVNHSSKDEEQRRSNINCIPQSSSNAKSSSIAKSSFTAKQLSTVIDKGEKSFKNQSADKPKVNQVKEPARNLEELKAAKDKLVQYQKLLEQVGMNHVIHN